MNNTSSIPYDSLSRQYETFKRVVHPPSLRYTIDHAITVFTLSFFLSFNLVENVFRKRFARTNVTSVTSTEKRERLKWKQLLFPLKQNVKYKFFFFFCFLKLLFLDAQFFRIQHERIFPRTSLGFLELSLSLEISTTV